MKKTTKKPVKKPTTKVVKVGNKRIHIHNIKEKTVGADFSKMTWVNVEKYIDDKDFLNHYGKLIANSTPKDFYFTVMPQDRHILINFAPIAHYNKHKRPISVAFYLRHILPAYCKFVPDAPPGVYEIETNLLEEVENVSEHMRTLGFVYNSEVSANFRNRYAKDMEVTDFIAKLILKDKDNDVLHKYVTHTAQPKDMYISIKDNYIYSVPKVIYDKYSQKQLKGLDSLLLTKYKAKEVEDVVLGYEPEYAASEEQEDAVKGIERTFSEEYDHCLNYLGDSVYVVHSNMEEIKSGLLNAGYELKDIPFDVAKKWAKKEKLSKEMFDSYVPPVEHKHCEDSNCGGCDDHPAESSEVEVDNSTIEADKPLTFENFPESDFSGIHKYHLMGLFSNCKPDEFYAHATECNEGDKSFIFIVPKAYWDKHKTQFPYEMPLTSMMPTMVGHYKENIWLCEGSPMIVNRILKLVKFDVSNEEYNEFIENETLENLLKVKELREIFENQK